MAPGFSHGEFILAWMFIYSGTKATKLGFSLVNDGHLLAFLSSPTQTHNVNLKGAWILRIVLWFKQMCTYTSSPFGNLQGNYCADEKSHNTGTRGTAHACQSILTFILSTRSGCLYKSQYLKTFSPLNKRKRSHLTLAVQSWTPFPMFFFSEKLRFPSHN